MAGTYTAILYFHGIGTQRRYEEISRLIDSLDQFAECQDPHTIGRLRAQQVALEPSRTGNHRNGEGYISYIRFNRLLQPRPETKRSQPVFAGSFRLYEGYWSSIIAAGLAPEKVLLWIAARAPMPFMSLAAPWRAHMRLKLSYLFRLQSEDPKGDTDNRTAYEQIADSYHRYESWGARRKFPKGGYSQFLEHLLSDEAAQRKDISPILLILRRWRRRFVLSQLMISLLVLTVCAGVTGMVTFAVYAVAPAAEFLGIPFAKEIVAWLPHQPAPVLTLLAFPFVLAGLALGRSFLKNFVADVTFWTAREGKSELFAMRKAILEQAVDSLRHVLLDDSCQRVVVIGHSLGSSIAYQALLELGRRRTALGKPDDGKPDPYPYGKISHFVTMGSPIETIHYFFELLHSQHHRYNRIADELQGSSASPPFRQGRTQAVRWVNLFSKADPISSPIFSQGMLRKSQIEQVEIVSMYAPSPAAAHSGYFSAQHSVARLFDIAILNDQANAAKQPLPRLARKIAHAGTRALHIGLLIASWALFAAAIGYWASTDALMRGGLIVALATGVALTVMWLGLRRMSSYAPLDVAGLAKATAATRVLGG